MENKEASSNGHKDLPPLTDLKNIRNFKEECTQAQRSTSIPTTPSIHLRTVRRTLKRSASSDPATTTPKKLKKQMKSTKISPLIKCESTDSDTNILSGDSEPEYDLSAPLPFADPVFPDANDLYPPDFNFEDWLNTDEVQDWEVELAKRQEDERLPKSFPIRFTTPNEKVAGEVKQSVKKEDTTEPFGGETDPFDFTAEELRDFNDLMQQIFPHQSPLAFSFPASFSDPFTNTTFPTVYHDDLSKFDPSIDAILDAFLEDPMKYCKIDNEAVAALIAAHPRRIATSKRAYSIEQVFRK